MRSSFRSRAGARSLVLGTAPVAGDPPVPEQVAVRVESHLVGGEQAGGVGDAGHFQHVHVDRPAVVLVAADRGDALQTVPDQAAEQFGRALCRVAGVPDAGITCGGAGGRAAPSLAGFCHAAHSDPVPWSAACALGPSGRGAPRPGRADGDAREGRDRWRGRSPERAGCRTGLSRGPDGGARGRGCRPVLGRERFGSGAPSGPGGRGTWGGPGPRGDGLDGAWGGRGPERGGRRTGRTGGARRRSGARAGGRGRGGGVWPGPGGGALRVGGSVRAGGGGHVEGARPGRGRDGWRVRGAGPRAGRVPHLTVARAGQRGTGEGV